MTQDDRLHASANQTALPDGDSFAAYDRQRDFSTKKFRSACYAPFVTLDFFSTGQIQVCCENWVFPLGNVKTDSIKDVWRGPRLQQLREALKRYDFSHGCQGCELAIKRGGRPFSMNYEMHQVDETSEWPRVMQFRLSNVCNFACVMCDGKHSSVIRRDRDHEPPLTRVYHDQFFNDILEFLPHLDSIVFSGGEPFLIQENYRIWDMLLEANNHRTVLSIITNGSVWNDRIAGYLDRLNIAHLTVSIDGSTKKTFERVRPGAHFETVIGNAQHFADATQRIRPRGRFGARAAQFSVSYCLMPDNFHEMPNVFLLAEGWEADVFVNVVTFPIHCSFSTLQPSNIKEAHRALTAAYKRIQTRLSPTNRERYLQAITTLVGMASDTRHEGLQKSSQLIDRIRSLTATVQTDTQRP